MAKLIEENIPERQWKKYDWDKWFDGQKWELTRGEDFECSPTSFRNTAYQTAYRRGMKVAIEIYRDTVRLRASFPEKSKAK